MDMQSVMWYSKMHYYGKICLFLHAFFRVGEGMSYNKLKYTRGETSMEKNRIRPIAAGKVCG